LAPKIAVHDSTDVNIVYLFFPGIRVFAALLLALTTQFTNYTHLYLLGTVSFDLPQQTGLPCIAVAVATALD